eukprot:TRINITY_DN5820_c0_g1_i6.p1 TRINITY_DN5820_c0_g1~~TRINITY_DN5820_c0_g1_i6.p1  ORF type:complete len:344 (-),score=90.53 TRINITY_DN5820_c0_g1_i6:89-1120(-)
MTTMKAWAQEKYGGSDVLVILDLPKPTPRPKDLLVKVLGVAVNPADIKVRTNQLGNPTLESPKILGWDGAGIVEAVGSEVQLFKPGDEVYFAGAIDRPGCNAEYVAVDERIVALKPKILNFRDASALPLCALTAWESLIEQMGIPIPKEGEPNPNEKKVLLVIAGAGGVGSIASQIAKKILKIGTVISTASRPESIEYCKKMGADFVINHRNDYKEELEKIGFSGVDYIMNNFSLKHNHSQLFNVINFFGKICIIYTEEFSIDMGILMLKRVSLHFELMFTRSISGIEIEKQHQILTQIAKYVDDGLILSRAEKVFEWSQFPAAHDWQEAGSAIGKAVLEVKF